MRLFKHDENAELNDQLAKMISDPVGERKSWKDTKKKEEDGVVDGNMNQMLRQMQDSFNHGQNQEEVERDMSRLDINNLFDAERSEEHGL